MFIGSIQKTKTELPISPAWENFGKQFTPEMTKPEMDRFMEGILSFVSQQIARDMKRMQKVIRKMREND